MHAIHDMKTLSVDDFAKQAELAGRSLVGWIRYDATASDVIYYGISPITCPQHPVPKGSIETLQVSGEGTPCHGSGSGEPVGVMFYARIVLKQDAPGGGLAKLVVSLANKLSENPISDPRSSGKQEGCCCSQVVSSAALDTGEQPSVVASVRPLSVVTQPGYYITYTYKHTGAFRYDGPHTYQQCIAIVGTYDTSKYSWTIDYFRAGQIIPNPTF
ncbi:hypothetical protein [Paludisphaera rhizosphaerae]|uniref:hypothetical protein n=1 Tax=Paludisphaera rhizosphaerae TaxID=2711216 RepID=UPI0013EB8710|nr:hypothetical protein [Paludisphaera rhizosphaerae]